MNTKVKTLLKKATASKTKQRFIRLNLDQKLDQMLSEFEVQYKLLNRSDIIRMLLSEIYFSKKQNDRQKFISFINSLPKAKTEYSEEEMTKILEENNLM
jgi:metal-responsive CopG/Arc/MetJ family transcriptional regulator